MAGFAAAARRGFEAVMHRALSPALAVAIVATFASRSAAGPSAALLAAPGAASASASAPAPKPGAITGEAAAHTVQRMLAQVTVAEPEPTRVSLVEAVRAAVENNPGIRSQAELPRRAAWVPYGATGAFDPKLDASAIAGSIHAPEASVLASGKPVFDEDAVRTGVSISKLLHSGASVDVKWASEIVNSNSIYYVRDPHYDNRLTFSLRQPLLRNLFASQENTTVLVARAQAEESLARFEASLAGFVSSVVDAYWNQIEAAAELEVSRRSLALARELERDADARVSEGILPKVAVTEAQANAARREYRAIAAENDVVVASRNLQYAVMLGAADNRAPEPLLPVEEHVVMPVELDRAASMKSALESRAEIRGASLALERSRLEESHAHNQRLWDLDLVAHYSMLGLSGGDTRDDAGNLREWPYHGNYGDSFDQFGSDNFHDYGVGLQLEVPFGNAWRKAELIEAEIDVRHASRELEQTISSVALDVDRALADVESAAKRVTAARAASELAQQNLSNQNDRFALGAVTTKDVLDFQQQLAEAMADEVRSITEHARAVTRLRLADGTLLARFDIRIEKPDAPGRPWWDLF
jgi:outer membrane protein TolC